MDAFEQQPQEWTGIPDRRNRPNIGLLLMAMMLGAIIGGAVVFFAVDDDSDATTTADDPPAVTTTTTAATTTSVAATVTTSVAPSGSILDLSLQATYAIEESTSGFVTLSGGSAIETSSASGGALSVSVVEAFAADLDGDAADDAVVILTVNTGGSEEAHYAYGVYSTSGQPKVTNAIPLGDRISIDDITVDPVTSIVEVRYRDRSDSTDFTEPPDALVIVDLMILPDGAETTGRGSILIADGNDPQVTTGSTITTGGLGPVRVGMTVAEATSAAGVALIAPTESSPTPSEGCGFARLDGLDGVGFMLIDGVIGRVDIFSGTTATASGAKIGSTEQEIMDLFGEVIVVTPHAYVDGHYLTLVPEAEELAEFRVVFETDGEVVTSYRAGLLPQVEFIEGCA